MIHKGGAKNIYVVNPANSHYGDVYALNLRPETLDDGHDWYNTRRAWRSAGYHPAVIVDTSQIFPRLHGRCRRAPQGKSTIAHELGHATNIRHHGEMPPDYLVDNVRCTLKDGTALSSFRELPAGQLQRRGGLDSGNDQCVMRYHLG